MARSLAIAYQMKRKGKASSSDSEMNYAKGGEVNPMEEVTCPHCAKSFSHGGQVANDTDEGVAADEKPNQFDDLVLNDDLEFKDTDANSGDEDSHDESYKSDTVSRAMLKRKAKK